MTRDRLASESAAVLAAVRRARPRVQCLTNTVAQQITANVLLAAGARVSMATHPDEVVEMTAGAAALLLNLGTIDRARIRAIPRLLADARVLSKPRVLDPVFVEHSRVRRAIARSVIAAGPLIVKGNASELSALALPEDATRVETGAIDRISSAGVPTVTASNGHPYMALVTGLGCALGGLIAACAAVEPAATKSATAAVLAFGIAGEIAAERAVGPGSFAVAFIDAIADLDDASLLARARISQAG